MDAQLTPPPSYLIETIDGPLSRIARRTIVLGAALVLFLCVFVAIRGLLGAFEARGAGLFLAIIALICEILAAAFRVVWLRLHPNARRESHLFARLGVPSICVACVAAALSMAAENGWAVGSIWLVVAVGELGWWYPELRAARPRGSEYAPTSARDTNVSPAISGTEQEAEEEAEIDKSIIQQMTRSRNADGVEVISGILRAEFAPGELLHNLHIAFCPPLAYDPAVVTHQLEGSPVTVKVAQSEIFGVRIELRRSAAAGTNEAATIYFDVHPG